MVEVVEGITPAARDSNSARAAKCYDERELSGKYSMRMNFDLGNTRNGLSGLFFGLLLPLSLIADDAVVDRIAVIIGDKAITESEVQDELRLHQFIEGQPLDLGPIQRRAAAERLVDRELIRSEMAVGYSPRGTYTVDADEMLRKFRQEKFDTLARYRSALAQYQITEEELKGHLVWQSTLIRFAEDRSRFQSSTTPLQTVNHTRSDVSVDDQMSAWLKRARSETHVVFKQ